MLRGCSLIRPQSWTLNNKHKKYGHIHIWYSSGKWINVQQYSDKNESGQRIIKIKLSIKNIIYVTADPFIYLTELIVLLPKMV